MGAAPGERDPEGSRQLLTNPGFVDLALVSCWRSIKEPSGLPGTSPVQVLLGVLFDPDYCSPCVGLT